MKLTKTNNEMMRRLSKLNKPIRRLILLLAISLLFAAGLNAQSTQEFKNGSDTLVVYSDVPGLTPSSKYTMRVRSAATNNEWVDVFANFTYNRADELEDIPNNDNYKQPICVQAYNKITRSWSFAYGNIEMNAGQVVEVEISAKPGFKIAGKDFGKATVHPAQKASNATIVGGKIYFTITKPGQIYIDINGQMDDYNAKTKPLGAPVHTICLFANPVIKKPTLTGSRVRTIEPGTSLATINTISPASYDTMYFKPGIHDLGTSGVMIHPGKTYYIPGDAQIYGTLSNFDAPMGSYSKRAENLTVYGYGTISGAKIPHYQYKYYYPDVVVTNDKPLGIREGKNTKIFGVTVADNGGHAIDGSCSGGTINWIKIIGWRLNSDGLGGYMDSEDCFINTNDDNSYLKSNRKRCTFWSNDGDIVHMANIPENRTIPIMMEDCDILYSRGVWVGSSLSQRGEGNKGQRSVNVIIRNLRFHDKLTNTPAISLKSGSGSSYKGILFQNISIAAFNVKQTINGSSESPWYGGLIFDNLTIGGTLVTNENYTTFFTTNEFVKDIWFRMPAKFTLTRNTIAAQGSISADPQSTEYIENSKVKLTAVPVAGYEFVSWSGDASGNTNPIEITMTGNKTVSATFIAVGTKKLTLNSASNGTAISSPAGSTQTTNSTVTLTAKPGIGYKFSGWSGDITNSNLVTTIKMDADKTVTPSFIKTNNFAINCGGDQYISADGTVYLQTPNGSYNTTSTITGTNDQFIYQSEKSGKTFSYNLPIDNGEYMVTLKFAELYWSSAGSRVFNCSIENVPVLTNFDIVAEAGGKYKALDKTFQTTIADGTLNIAFTTITDNAKISGISIMSSNAASVEKMSLSNDISIYPNPASSVLNIDFIDTGIDKTVKVFNSLGQLVYSSNTNTNIQLDVISLKLKGMVMVQIEDGKTVINRKVIVN